MRAFLYRTLTKVEPGSVVPGPSVQKANDTIKTLDEQFSKMSTTSETLRYVLEKVSNSSISTNLLQAPEVRALEHNEQLVLEHLMQAKVCLWFFSFLNNTFSI